MTLENRLQAFDDTRRSVLDEMEALDPALLVAQPIPGKWSMIEIVEHLVLAERAVFRGLPDPRRLEEKPRDFGNRVRYALVLFILTSGIPVRPLSPRWFRRAIAAWPSCAASGTRASAGSGRVSPIWAREQAGRPSSNTPSQGH